MSGVPNELWKQLTSLLGSDTDDVFEEEEQQIEGESDEACHAVEQPTNHEFSSVHVNSAPVAHTGTGSRASNQHLAASDMNVTNESAACDVEGGDAEDESDDGSVVEIGVEECCMLKDCLQRKLDSLMRTEERYTDIT